MFIINKIFLGGTCAETVWRDELIKLLKIDYFNPVVPDWTEECMKAERYEREHCDFCLYVITPSMEGVYSIAEAIDDSNKRPEKTLFCFLEKEIPKLLIKGLNLKVYPNDLKTEFTKSQIKSLEQVSKMIERNGGKSFKSLEEIADYVNGKDV